MGQRSQREPRGRPGWQNLAVTERKWIDQSQPQTLQAAVLLCYLNAGLAVLYFVIFGAGPQLALLLLAVAAYAIANERRWGYWGAVVLSCLYLVSQLLFFALAHSFGGVLNLLFAGVLVAALLHPQSRQYEKVWFH